jgi:hypothetical protein
MFDIGLLVKQEYNQAEHYLADKYCIKKGNLYRLIDLTIPSNRVIDRVSFKEGKNEEDSHKYKHISVSMKSLKILKKHCFKRCLSRKVVNLWRTIMN